MPADAPARDALARARAAYAAGDLAGARSAVAAGLAVAERRSSLAAELHVEEARLLLWSDGGLEAARRAHRLALATGAPMLGAEVVLGTALFMAGKPSAISHLRRAHELATATPRTTEPYEPIVLLASALRSFRRSDEALRACEEALRERPRRRSASALRQVHAEIRATTKGEYREAIEEMRTVDFAALGAAADPSICNFALLLGDTGDDGEATSVLDGMHATRSAWGRAYRLYARAEVELAAGRSIHALTVAGEGAPIAPPHLAPLFEHVRRWAQLDAGLPVDPPPLTWPPIPPFLDAIPIDVEALAAVGSGEYERAEQLFLRAARRWKGELVPFELRSIYGSALAATRAGGAERGHRRARRAALRARQLGLAAIAGRLEGLGHGPRRARARPLTGRQDDIMRLVGRGHTTADIARELGISKTTVEWHVRQAMRRLNARTRVQAAAATAPSRGTDTRTLDGEETRLLALLNEGASVAEAARILHISRRTATRRLASIRRKLDNVTTAEAVVAYGQHGRRGRTPPAS